MKRRQKSRGFTLVEISTIVVLIGVLATVAAVGYIRYRRHARMAEASALLAGMRSAEEAYKQESGVYYQASNDENSYYPAATPGAFTTAWGGPCGNCVTPNAWETLSVHPDGPVMYGYSATSDVGVRFRAHVMPEPPTCHSIAPDEPYYIIQAEGDVDGDGVKAHVMAVSCSSSLIVTNEGE